MRPLVTVATMLATLAVAPAALAAPSTERVSVGAGGAELTGDSYYPAISADGRYVAFVSDATNVVAGDTNGVSDVFYADRLTGAVTRISVGPGGVQADARSTGPHMSDDGRFVVFDSDATNLTSAAAPARQVYLWDRTTGTLRRLSGLAAPYDSASAEDISADGSRVSFNAPATSAVEAAVFVADTGTGAVRRVSDKPGGGPSNAQNLDSALSADGRWIAWRTLATNVVTPDTNGRDDVVMEDLQTGQRVRVSDAPGGAQGNGDAYAPDVDASGCRVLFESRATNLPGDDGAANGKLWLRDRCAGTTELVSRSDDESTQAAADEGTLSADGCTVLYATADARSAPVPQSRVAVRDRCAGTTRQGDVSTTGSAAETNPLSGLALGGRTSRYAAFATVSTNLVPRDTNGVADVFVRDLGNNLPPAANLVVAVLDGGRVRADLSGSSDPDGFRLTGRIAWGDGTLSDGLTGEHVFPPGLYDITATVIDADGAGSSIARRVTVPGPPTATPRPRPALVLDRVKLSRSRFAVAPRRGRARGNRGATLSLRLSEPASVTVGFERVQRGRKRAKQCVPGRRRGARCTKVTPKGTVRRTLKAGTQRIALTGRVANRALARGTYRLVVSARTADGRRSATRRLGVRIVRATR